MMDFMTGGSLSNVLAPKLEIGQEALYDALRARDVKRATRIIKRVARGHGDGREAGGHATGGNVRRVQEVRGVERTTMCPAYVRTWWCKLCFSPTSYHKRFDCYRLNCRTFDNRIIALRLA